MSFMKLVRNYLEQNESSHWIAKIAAPAALSISLGLGCGGSDVTEQTGALEQENGKGDKITESVTKCTEDKDCQPDQYCKKTIVNTKCPKGAFCVVAPWYINGVCEDLKPGDECETNRDCHSGQHCKKVVKIGKCPTGAYCVIAPIITTYQCVDNQECLDDKPCDPGQRCVGAEIPDGDTATNNNEVDGKIPTLHPIVMPYPEPVMGTCMNECEKNTDCAIGERCVKPTVEKETKCGEKGVYCILPPPSIKGLCEPRIYAIFAPIPESNK